MPLDSRRSVSEHAPQGVVPPVASLARKTSLSAVASAVASVGGLVSSVAAARLLGPAGSGAVAMSVWISSTAVLVFGLGIPQALTRYLALEGRGSAVSVRAPLVRTYLVLVLAGAGVLVAALYASRVMGLGSTVSWSLILLFLTQAASTLDMAVAAGDQDFSWIARRNVIGALGQVLGVALGAAAFGPKGGILGYAVGLALMARRSPRLIAAAIEDRNGDRSTGAIRFAATSWVAAVVSLVTWSRLEFVFLERSFGAGEVAMYAAALSLTQLATQPVTLLSGALLPHFSELAGRAPSALATSYETTTRLLGLVAFPLAFGLSAVASPLVNVLFGGSFAAAATPAAIIAPVAALGAVAAAGSALVYASGRSGFIAASGIAVGAVAVVLFWMSIRSHGIVGAAVARGIVQCGAVLLGWLYIALRLGARVPIRALASAAACGAAAAVPTRIACTRLGVGPVSLLVGFLLFVTLYVTLVRVTRALRREDAEALVRVLSGVHSRWLRPVGAGIAWMGRR